MRIIWSGMLVAQLCPTLCFADCSFPGSSVHGIFQARTLEWLAIPFSRGSSQTRNWIRVSCIAGRFFTVWATGIIALQYCIGFCCTTWINHKYIHVCSSCPPPQHPYPLPPTALGYHRALCWAPCVIEWLPISYLFCIW